MSSTTLLDVVEKGSLEEIQDCLKIHSSELNETSGSEGYTPLIAAVIKRNVKIAELLLDAGANPNISVSGNGMHAGYTGIHIAAKNGDVDLLKALAKAGADINLEGKDSWCPMHVAAFSGKRNSLLTLVELGAKIDVMNKHNLTPLMYVSDHGRMRETRDLLQKGANITLKDVNGDGMLHHALHYQMQKLFEGEYDMPECQYDVMVVLAMNGADPDVKNNDGALCTQYAVEGIQEILRILFHHRDEFQKSKTEWNYMTLLSAQIEHFLGVGLPLRHATDLYQAMKKCEKNRLEQKKEREEARKGQGGCPVIRSKKSANANASAITASTGSSAPDGSADPSGGQCPFFQKSKATATREESKDIASPHTTSSSTTSASQSVTLTSTDAAKCPFGFGGGKDRSEQSKNTNSHSFLTLVYENRTAVMMCIIFFLLGSLMERKLTTIV